jgi:hypothetical protein
MYNIKLFLIIVTSITAFKNVTLKSIYSQTLLCEYQTNILNCLINNKCVNRCRLECLINEQKNINNKKINLCKNNNQLKDCKNFTNLINNLNNCNYNSNFDIVNICVTKILDCSKYKINSSISKNNDYIFIGIIFGILFLLLCIYFKHVFECSTSNKIYEEHNTCI